MTLREYFMAHPRAAIACSGGVDSAFLLWAAVRCGAAVRAYYVKTAFQPQFELEDARRLAQEVGADLRILNLDVLCRPEIARNGADRCYHCKKAIMTCIRQAAEADGFNLILDGTNASDQADDRPGMTALRELEVQSPLRLCGLTKAEIRRQSKEAGLFTWNKPAYACLATRTATGQPLTEADLHRTEQAEEWMKTLGFSDFRVRTVGNTAKIQVKAADLERVFAQRKAILDTLHPVYDAVVLDLEERHEQ